MSDTIKLNSFHFNEKKKRENRNLCLIIFTLKAFLKR